MAEQAFFTLGEAAKATGKSKATISNAIKNGRLSVHERTANGYRIAAAELFRAFTPNSSINSSIEQTLTPESNALNGLNRALEREIEILREERERERQQAQSTIDDLRRRIDATDEERRRLTVLLTNQTAHKPSWWDRLRGRG
jgi:hypothetical protein